ncbi:MAG: hypothetical protein IT441_07890 [Phycisphaeraceae bacterium]|nr:hypothetical protein [Phycisphaeraceae bacterium]
MSKRTPFFVTMLLLIGASPSLADKTDDKLAAMQAQLNAQAAQMAKQEQTIAAQNKKIAELNATSAPAPAPAPADLTSGGDAHVREIVQQVMADAQTRPSLSDKPLAGYDNGLYARTADGNYMLKVNGVIQIRYTLDSLDHPTTDSTGGFELPHADVIFSGNVLDPTWKYRIVTGYNTSGGTNLQDAWVEKSFSECLALTAGQFKPPFWEENLVAYTKLQFIDRSLLNAIHGGYTQGLMLSLKLPRVRTYLSFNDGMRAAARNSTWSTDGSDLGLTARGEVLLTGDWKNYGDMASFRGEKTTIVLGSAAHYELSQTAATPDLTQITGDATFKFGGASLFVAGLARFEDGATAVDRYGVLTQAGVFVTDKIELVARHEWGAAEGAVDDLNLATAGINYYFLKHQAKFMIDAGYSFGPVDALWANTAYGWRADSAGRDGQFVARTQLQIGF